MSFEGVEGIPHVMYDASLSLALHRPSLWPEGTLGRSNPSCQTPTEYENACMQASETQFLSAALTQH